MAVYVFRSLPLDADSRTTRNGEIFHNHNVAYFTWEQSSGPSCVRHCFKVNKSGTPLLKALKFLLFSMWVGFEILIKVKKGEYVVLMDLETAIFGVFAAKIKGAKIIFDIVDPAAQTKTRNKFWQRILDWVEVNIGFFADYIFIPHECRSKYYLDKGVGPLRNENVIVVENVPNLDVSYKDYARSDKEKIVIGYFGTLDTDSRGLEWLFEFAKKYSDKYVVYIAGRGKLESEVAAQALIKDNIIFHGSFSSVDLKDLYSKIDVSWAYYTPRIDLHRYAAPNKYYEHLFFSTPLIISSCIPQAEKIGELNSGVEVNAEDYSDAEYSRVDRALISIVLENKRLKNRLYEVWESQYKDYYANLRKVLISNGIVV